MADEDSYETHQSDRVAEQATGEVSGQVRDEKRADLTLADITTFTMTLLREDGSAEGTVVGDWDDKNIKNANGGTVEANGLFAVVLPWADLTVIPPDARTIRYKAVIRWTWAGGTKRGVHVHSFPVGNVEGSP